MINLKRVSTRSEAKLEVDKWLNDEVPNMQTQQNNSTDIKQLRDWIESNIKPSSKDVCMSSPDIIHYIEGLAEN